MARRRMPKQVDSPFEKLPTELYHKIFSYLDIQSFRAVRTVSKVWNDIAAISNHISFRCHLTDETIKQVINSDELYPQIKIYDFQGAENGVVSSTRGTGRIFRNADIIHLMGRNINQGELTKMMQYATKSVTELLFQHCSFSLQQSLLKLGKPFASLQKLTIYMYYLKQDELKLLQDFGSIAHEMPKLEHLKMAFEFKSDGNKTPRDHFLQVTQTLYSEPIFSHYMALIRILLAYKASLKRVEILRDYLMQTILLQLQRNLKELHIDKSARVIVLTPLLTPSQALQTALPITCNYLTSIKLTLKSVGREPLDLTLFSQSPGLKVLWLEFLGGFCIGETTTLEPMNAFSCTNLEQLPKTITSLHLKSADVNPFIVSHQLILSSGQLRWIVENLKDLESFWIQLVVAEILNGDEDDCNDYEDDSDKDRQNESGPTIDKAHIWLQLVLESDGIQLNVNGNEEINERRNNEFNEEEHNGDDGENENDNADGENGVNNEDEIDINNENQRENEEMDMAQDLENARVHTNIDIHTFRNLISMPKLRYMKFDMLKAKYCDKLLEADENIENEINAILRPFQSALPKDMREFSEICELDPKLEFSKRRLHSYSSSFIEFSLASITKT
ncbi:unnamed protein product [Orchesella dallaii]|uniref:F-box domain-containing protein n=1 Tax=Orchesella dallaii TaxID=48710 RepID=A0ABP1QT17_9HEXA